MTPESLTILSYTHPIILFDGVCHLCHRSVQAILERDTTGFFRFCPLQEAEGFTNTTIQMDSVILLWRGQILTESDAVIESLILLGGRYKWLGILKRIPRFIRNAAYRLIAAHRYSWFGKSEHCLMPKEEWKKQFLP